MAAVAGAFLPAAATAVNTAAAAAATAATTAAATAVSAAAATPADAVAVTVTAAAAAPVTVPVPATAAAAVAAAAGPRLLWTPPHRGEAVCACDGPGFLGSSPSSPLLLPHASLLLAIYSSTLSKSHWSLVSGSTRPCVAPPSSSRGRLSATATPLYPARVCAPAFAMTRQHVDDIGATCTSAMAGATPLAAAPPALPPANRLKTPFTAIPAPPLFHRPPSSPPRVRFSWVRFAKFVGPGFLVSVAFIDPGNIECDLQVCPLHVWFCSTSFSCSPPYHARPAIT